MKFSQFDFRATDLITLRPDGAFHAAPGDGLASPGSLELAQPFSIGQGDLFNELASGSFAPHALPDPGVHVLRAGDAALDGGKSEVAFIDGSVKGWQTLAADVRPGVEVVVVSGSHGLEQIADFLQGHANLDAVHIFSHGNSAVFEFGGENVTSSDVATYGSTLAKIGASLTHNGDLLLYGCDIASGNGGQTLINQLSHYTSADVAASSDLTGAASLGGNWDLEYHAGTIDVSTAVDAMSGANYNLALANYSLGLPSTTISTAAPSHSETYSDLTVIETDPDAHGGSWDYFHSPEGPGAFSNTFTDHLTVDIKKTDSSAFVAQSIGVFGGDTDADSHMVTIEGFNGSTLVGQTTVDTSGHSYSDLLLVDLTSVSGFGGSITDLKVIGLASVEAGNLTIADTNAPPTANPDTSSSDAVESGSPVTGNVLSNDSDPNSGDTISVTGIANYLSTAGTVGSSLAGHYGHLTVQANGGYSYVADLASAIDAAGTGSHLTDVFTYTVSDNHGASSSTTLTITIDRAPTAVGDNYGTVAEGASTGLVNGASGVLANDSDKDGDTLTISAISGGVVGSSTATTYGHITLNSDGSYTYVADGASAINSAPAGSHPIDTVNFTVSDSHGGATSETLTFTIDRPAIAVADGIDTNENATVTASTMATGLLGNDSDPDTGTNAGLAVTAVNGSAGNVGNQIVFADGSFITVNADGTYIYDPNHAWDFLPTAASGAPSTGTETFSYTITGGSTVNVTITIHGVDSNDTLQGTAGNDTYNGGIGDDIFKMQDGGTDNVTGGLGNDSFYFGASLSAADTINGGTGTDALILGGNYTLGNAVVMSATTMTSVEQINLHSGFSYDLTTSDANVAAGATLTVNGAQLGVGDSLIFNGSAETDGQFVFKGGAGNDTLTGGAQSDTFTLTLGGNDTVHGGGGNDKFYMAGSLTAGDAIDGGAGDDVLNVNGDYSSGVTFGANTMTNIATLYIGGAGFDYGFTTNDGNVAAGHTLNVNASSLGAGDSLTFDGSAETDGSFSFIGGAGNDVLTGGAQADRFLSGSGNDTINGGGGGDRINMGAFLTAADQIDGGAGHDTLYLGGDYSGGVTFNATTMVNVETVHLTTGYSYALTMDNATVGAGQTLGVNASTLSASDRLNFDGSNDTTGGSFDITGGAGNDTLTGGWAHDVIRGGDGNNTLQGGGGADALAGGAGADLFVYNQVSDSTSTGHDRITDFDAASDTFQFTGDAISAIDPAVGGGNLSTGNFDAQLATKIGAGQLGANHAVLYTPTGGDLHNHVFLVVDANGVAGYQDGQDYVIDITGATNLGSLSIANFTH